MINYFIIFVPRLTLSSGTKPSFQDDHLGEVFLINLSGNRERYPESQKPTHDKNQDGKDFFYHEIKIANFIMKAVWSLFINANLTNIWSSQLFNV